MTGISYVNETVNCVTGCTKVSEGCDRGAEMNHEQAREILAAACKALNALTAEIKQLPDRNHYWTGDIQVENWIVSITVNRKEDK